MHKILDEGGAVTGVAVTSAEWNAIHRQYKVSHGGKDRRTLVLCEKRGTVLVPAQITANGLPAGGQG